MSTQPAWSPTHSFWTIQPNEMGLCEKCQSLATEAFRSSESPSVDRYDYLSFRRAVDGKCFVCSHVWDSLSEEQKGIASKPGFMGITYRIYRNSRPGSDEGEPILATLSFQHGDDLFDCEECNKVGGLMINSAGVFAFLDPSGEYSPRLKLVQPLVPTTSITFQALRVL